MLHGRGWRTWKRAVGVETDAAAVADLAARGQRSRHQLRNEVGGHGAKLVFAPGKARACYAAVGGGRHDGLVLGF